MTTVHLLAFGTGWVHTVAAGHMHVLEGPVAIGMGVLGAALLIWSLVYIHVNEDRLSQGAEHSGAQGQPAASAT